MWGGPLREGKTTTWEGGIREPGIVRWPGKVAPMRTSSEVVTTYDIFPTVAAILGVQPNVTIDGRDMTPVLLDAAAKTSHDCLYHWKGATGVYEGRQLDGLWAVRCGAYKVMRREGGGWGGLYRDGYCCME